MRFSRRQLAFVSYVARGALSTILSLQLAAGPDWLATPAAAQVSPVQVTLTAFTLPSQGQAGSNVIYVNGSGYPTDTIPASNVTVSFARSCGGTRVASATASAFQLLYGTTRRAQVLIPAALTANTYFVSTSGTTSSGTPFLSSNCSQLQVTSSVGPAAKLAFTTQPGNGAAGSPLGNVVVQVQDANGNVVTGSSASITMSSIAAGVGGTTTVGAASGVATFSNLVFTAVGSYTLTAASAGLTSATSTPFTISAAAAAKLVFSTQPGNGVAGSPLGNVVVQVQDANGNVVTGSNASITMTSTAAGVGGTTTVAAVGGAATFSNLIFTAAGSYTLTAASAGLTSATSTPFTISVGAPGLLVFTGEPPSSVKILQTFAVQTTVEDSFGEVVTSYNGPVTLALGNNPGGVRLAGTTTQNAVNGVASFAGLSVNTVSTGYALVATAGNLTGTSNAFKVTASPQLAACVPSGSQSLLILGSNVTSYVPNGVWFVAGLPRGKTNVEVVPVEGTGQSATIQTPNIVNSCASNSVTGETVCTADGTDVYVIQGSTLTNTLTSGSNAFSNASAGSCMNCGVAINPVTNQAVIAMGFAPPGGIGNEGIQVLDLNTNSFSAPIAGNDRTVSEGIVVDPERNLVLAPNGNLVAVPNGAFDYELFDLNSGGKVFDRNIQALSVPGTLELDSAAEDCSTGIALATEESSDTLFITDLTQASFDPTALPHPTWTAPAQVQAFPEFQCAGCTGTDSPSLMGLAAGTAAIAVASGAHLGIVMGDGGNTFGVIQLPATSGNGTPAIIDYVVAVMPEDPSGNGWQSGHDPHPTSAYISPNNGKAFGVLTESLDFPNRYLAIIDLQGMLSAPRSGAHTVGAPSDCCVLNPTVDLVGTGLVRFVPIGFNPPAQLVFSPQPAGAVAGQSFPVQVAVEDAQGNVIVNNGITGSFSITLSLLGSGGTFIHRFIGNTVNGVASFSIAIQEAGTYTFSAISSSLPRLPAATSNAFTITPATAASLAFTRQPTDTVVGQALPTIQVSWFDQFGNPTSSTLPVTLALTHNAVGATLSGITTVVPVNGVASFIGLTVDRPSFFTLTATGGGFQAVSAFFQITSGAPATQLAFVTQPTTAPAGQAMNVIQVAVEDAFGNVVTSANNPVTLALGANPSGATLSALPPGTTSVMASGGLATFSNLTINFAGLGYTMVASSPGLHSATSTPFNITGAGPPSSLTPNTVRQGTTVSVTITAQNTHLQQGVTTASFGPGLMVGGGVSGGFGPVNVTSPTTAIAQVSAAANAIPGLRTVVLQTGAEQDTFFDAFAVLGTPFLNSITPSSGRPGQTLSVTIHGVFTNFVQGTTQANFGLGISVGGGTPGGYGPVTVTGPGTALAQITIASGASVGLRTPITVQTGTEQASLLNSGFLILGPVTGPAPVVNFTSLTEGMEITAPTAVTGTITSPNLSTWTLDYAPTGSNSFTTFATGTTSAVSGTLDPTLLLNGMTMVRLTAVDQSGRTTSTTVNVVITRNLKVGNFTLSFLDLNIPVAGIPIQVVRTYDSRDKTVGDFGFGWSLSIKTTRIDVNGILGNSWTGTVSSGLLPTYCIQPPANDVVSVRLQDGTVYQFAPTLTAATQCSQILPPSSVDMAFTPIGTTPPSATLTSPAATGLLVSGLFPGPIQLLDLSTLNPVDPDQFILTLPTGQQLRVSRSFGVQAITDRNGNTLTIGPNGIASSNGPGVTFTRDAQNRIVSIRDPNLNLLAYTYDGDGDLTSFQDQLSNVSKFTYDTAHNLISFTDPTGAQPIRNVYDDNGRLIQTVDPLGHVLNFTHDIASRTETIIDFLSNPTTYVYDDKGQIIQRTDPLGGITRSTFDANGNKTSETDPLGRTTLFAYDANNNRLSITDPAGNVLKFTYDSQNHPLTLAAANGSVITDTYDANGNLLTLTNALGEVLKNSYNSSGQPISTTDLNGNTTSLAYDNSGNLVSLTDPIGTVTTYTYDANGNQLTQSVTRTTPSGPQTLLTRYQYDAMNRRIQTIFPDGSTQATVYNSVGQKASDIDALGRQTSYEYDFAGRLTTITYADGLSETRAYDADGRVIQSVARNGAATSFTYDALGRQTSSTDASGAVTSMAYDAAGQIVSTTDALGHTTQSAYDAAGRRTKVIDAQGGVTTLAYDSVGRPTSRTDANGHTKSFQYDAAGHETRVTFADGTFQASTYDAIGNLTSTTDAAGKVTRFGYDALNRLISVTDAIGQITSYTYDEVGNRVSQIDANNHTTAFQYDQRGHVLSRTLPLGQREMFGYDAVGNLLSHTDFNGKTTVYTYDSISRLIAKTPDPSFSQPPVTYTYTALGTRATMTDATGVTTYSYDSLNQLISKQTPEGTLQYTYDADGNLTQVQAGAFTVTYSYDSLNRLAAVAEASTGTTTYGYDAVGNLNTVMYPNGITHGYSYDSRNRLTTLGISKGAAQVNRYTYVLDAAGHRTSVSESTGRTVSYTYDSIYRLTSESIAGALSGQNGTVTYTYDPVGNRTQANSTLPAIPAGLLSYDANDRLMNAMYDSNGNILNAGGAGNIYDFENRLIQRGGVTLVYDGDGNRVSKTAGGITTKYLVDELSLTGFPQVLMESASDGSSRTYVYGLERISQQRFDPQTHTTQASFYLYDGQSSVRALANAAGATTDTYEYDAFGNLLHSTGSTPNNYLFDGEQYDPDLHAYFLRARYYDPTMGRFLSMDPARGSPQDPMSLHRYLYGHNDPVDRIDPSGMFDLVEFAIGSAIVGELSGAVLGFVACGLRCASEGAKKGFIGGLLFGVAVAVVLVFTASVGSAIVISSTVFFVIGTVLGITTLTDPNATGREKIAAGLGIVLGLLLYARGIRSSSTPTPVPTEVKSFSGHGYWNRQDGYFIMPDGNSLTLPTELGNTISDAYGNALETGGDVSPFASESEGGLTFLPGARTPNVTLEYASGLKIQGKPTLVDKPTLVADMLREPNQGHFVWAACCEIVTPSPPPLPHPPLPLPKPKP